MAGSYQSIYEGSQMDQRWTLAYSAVQRIFVNGQQATKEGTDVELTVVEQEVVDAILALIPSAASALNKLTDKAYVDSSIATAAATFRGTSPEGLTQAQFLAWANALEHDKNDTVFWKTTDTVGNTLYKKYKYNGTEWKFEYDLNNSSFTAAQWAAINSGITAATLGTISDRANEGHTAYGYFTNGKLPYASISGAPTELPNPEALSWSGYSSGSYDGSEAAEIEIPNNTNQLTNGAGFITSSALSPYAQKTWVNTNFRTAAAQDDIDAILGASIQSLQSQIDAVASRDSFDELTATALYADTLAASNVYLGLIAAGTWNGAAIADEYISSAAKWNAFVDMFEYDATTRTLILKKDGDNARHFASYGGIAGGGIGQGGGGGGEAIWGAIEGTLSNQTDLWSVLQGKQASLGVGTNGQILATRNGAIAWVDAPATGVTSFNTRTGAVVLTASDVEGVLNLSPIENAIKSLQSQVDSVSARDGFDELYATSLFSDIIVGTNIYGALHGNADSATDADTLDGQHGSYYATASALSTHVNNTDNPHGVTKTQLGLGNVENKSSATIRGELTADNVTTALGATYVQNASYATSAGNADKVDGEHSSAFAHIAAHNDLTASGNEFTFASSGFSGAIYLNYRTAGGTNGNITDYIFSNGAGGTLTNLSTLITRSSHGETAYNDLTTVSNAVRSLQSQVDSVASRLGAADTAMEATFALADSAGENISESFSVVSRALQSLQSQIDSVASRDYAELEESLRALKMWIESMFELTPQGIFAKYTVYTRNGVAAGGL